MYNGLRAAPGPISPVIRPPQAAMFPPDQDFELETFCPLKLVRSHTKTDDIVATTDDQLILYRKAALEAAEKYTGLRLARLEQISERFNFPNGLSYNQFHDMRRKFKHRLQYPSAEDYVYIIGPGVRERVEVDRGKRKFTVGNLFHNFDFAQCCRRCEDGSQSNGGFLVYYRSGFRDAATIPAGVVLGMLKFIAWTVENPGDVYMSVRNNATRGTGAQDGTNNAAWASGALEEWRIYVDDAT